jgi:hypothetical protein
MKLMLTIFLVVFFAHSGWPQQPSRDQTAAPVFKLTDKSLVIKYGGGTYTIDNIFSSENPALQWDPQKLLSPDGKSLVVPMSDSIYRIYALNAGKLELARLIDGGVLALKPGSYWRSRNHWRFTGWANADTLLLAGDTAGDEFVLQAEVNASENTVSYRSKEAKKDQVALREMDPERLTEAVYQIKDTGQK